MWKEGEPLPNRGWYGGRVDLMILNGTYEDLRPRIEASAKRGKFATVGSPKERIQKSMKKMEGWDAEWAALPLEEKINRRNLVADNSEVRRVVVNTVRGPMTVFQSTPENNDNLRTLQEKNAKKLPQHIPTGAIRRDNMPATFSMKMDVSEALASEPQVTATVKRGRPAKTATPV